MEIMESHTLDPVFKGSGLLILCFEKIYVPPSMYTFLSWWLDFFLSQLK